MVPHHLFCRELLTFGVEIFGKLIQDWVTFLINAKNATGPELLDNFGRLPRLENSVGAIFAAPLLALQRVEPD